MRSFSGPSGRGDHHEGQAAYTGRIISRPREAEALLNGGATIGQVCQKLGISEQTFHRWRNQYGGMKSSAAKRMKELEEENRRLKQAVADLTLDKQILKEANDFLGNG